MKTIKYIVLLCICLFAFLPIVFAEEPSNLQGTSNSTTTATTTNTNWLSSTKVSCGTINNIPSVLPKLTSNLVSIFEILAPVLLIIFGSIDLGKGIMGGKEDEIKKAQHAFSRRLLTSILLFFIIALTKMLVSIMADGEGDSRNMIQCVNCFISNDCSSN